MTNTLPVALATLFVFLLAALPVAGHAASSVEQNSNVVGTTLPGYYRGMPAMQDNESSCAINPILPRNIVCAWNASGGADDVIGDTWVRFSESLDGGRTFFNRYLNGSNLNPASSVGQQFGADPVMMCWPGGCGTIMLAATRAETGGGEGGGIYMQMMVDLNTESGFRKAFKVNLDRVYRATGSKFADKPHGLYVLNEDDPGTVTVTMPVEMPDGSVESVTREWPKATIIVVFALFNPSKNDIEILTMQTTNYGGDWTNPKQIAQTSGRDQGVSVAAIGDNVLYTFRRFANGTDDDAMMGVITTRQGQRVGKPFEIASDICAYDAPTLPNTANSSAAAARSNDFPWASQNGSKFIMVYSERRRSSDGGCLTNTAEPSDSRVMAVVGSANGKNWSTPKEVAPNPGHGFQFMPVVDCSLGVCQVAWWDSRRDSQKTRDFLTAQGDVFSLAALNAFETLPIFADFNFSQAPGGPIMQFRRTADMFTKKVYLDSPQLDTSDEAVLASRYRLGLFNGELAEMEANPFHVKAYKSNQVPFMGDYNSMTSVKHRLVFDPADPTAPLIWEENAGPNPLNPAGSPLFWLSWTDGRNMRGQIYAAEIDGQLPYTKTPVPAMARAETGSDEDELTASERSTLTAESVEDSNPGAGYCTPVADPGPGGQFTAINNRVKDADIYGALIENKTSAWSLNPTKTLGNIQRTYTLVAENEGADARLFRFEIANQPGGFPTTARASWVQVPFDPIDPTFATTDPSIVAFEPAGPRSSVTVALFLVSQEPVNPVSVRVYDHVSGELINTITVNGSIESGPLLNPDGSLNELELHNPLVYAPDQYNPDQFNPDQYNPDQFNPDLYNPDQFNPDQFNPDQFNPDQFNPDQYNPDQFNPDLFNPDLFNPDQFNPDQFNPDQFNSSLTDGGNLHNPEIPDPDLSTIERDADGTVVRVDVNYGIQNMGNTLTAYSVDFAVADPDVLALIENGEITTQLIAWQDKQVRDVQYCNPALISENRVIAAVNNPDLTTLNIPDIHNNRVGSLTYFIGFDDIMQNTIRFIGPRDKIEIVANALPNDIISYVFASQAANTGEYDLGIGREQVVNDRTPARFNRSNGDITTFEASGPSGAILPADFVTAAKDGEAVAVICAPALGSVIGLDIANDPSGPTALTCEATSSNGVTARLDMSVSVLDTMPPVIDPTSVPADLVVEAESAAGSIVTYTTPSAADVFGVDTDVDVACLPASGSLFTFTPPGPTTTGVTCTATDDSGNADTASFNVVVQDTSPPVFPPDFPGTTNPPTEPFVLAPDANSFQLYWGPFDVTDSDPNIDVSCNVGELVPGPTPPYTFVYDFPVGDTTVTCTASDSNGASVSASFTVTIVDETPPVITLNGPETITLETGSGPYQDPGATATDNADGTISVDVDSSAVDTTTAGTYTVLLTATDSSGNTAQLTRTVIVEFVYGMTGIIPAKTNVKIGSSNPLEWAWLGADGMPADSSGDIQLLTIRNCQTGEIILAPAGDPGSSGFRYKSDHWWQFNWETFGEKGKSYCAAVQSGLSGQVQYSPPIRLR